MLISGTRSSWSWQTTSQSRGSLQIAKISSKDLSLEKMSEAPLHVTVYLLILLMNKTVKVLFVEASISVGEMILQTL
jgi:hypothetical protein